MIELYSKQASASGMVSPPPWGDTGSIVLSDGKEYGYVFPVINDQATFDQYMTTDAFYYATAYPYQAFDRIRDSRWGLYGGKDLYTFNFKESVYINAVRYYGHSSGSSWSSKHDITYCFEDGSTYTHTPYFTKTWGEYIFTDPRFYTQKVAKFTTLSISGTYPYISEIQFLYLKESV